MLLNKPRASEKMRQYGFAALIATFSENVTYITGHQSHLSTIYRFLNVQNYALIGAREDIPSALIIERADAGWAAAYPPTVDEIYTFGHGSYTLHEGISLDPVEKRFSELMDQKENYGSRGADALIKCLKKRGITRGKVGLDEKGLDPATRTRLSDELPHVEFVDAFELFRVIRMVKTEEEIERLRQAALINENALNDLMAHFRVGVTEEGLAKVFRKSTAEQGACVEFLHANNARRASYIMLSSGSFDPPSDYPVRKGDLYKFDGGSIYRKYHSDTGHCFLAGETNKHVEKIHQVIKNAMDRVREVIRPGIKPSQVFGEVVEAMAKGGIENYGPFCGHAIGLEAETTRFSPPPSRVIARISPESGDFPLEANMVINIEFPYRELGFACWQMEHSLLVTEKGNELLIPQNRELRVL